LSISPHAPSFWHPVSSLSAGLVLAAVFSLSPGQAGAQGLTVSAASSLADVMVDIGRAYEKAGGPPISLHAAGSNTLARQIVEGAPIDVFISADMAQMDVVERSGRLVPGSRRDLLTNTLVVVVPAGRGSTVREPADLSGSAVRRVALGNPQSVPAGVYARQWLERLQLWDAVAPKVVPTLTVRAALAAVRGGRADAGVVFATDAISDPQVAVVYRVPADDGPPIRYQVSVVRGEREREGAEFVSFLSGPEARRIFEAAGFVTLD
jgi:molybdate transport system substrate-binding protein